jgi:tetratricopeptide (TPR) repeat protein
LVLLMLVAETGPVRAREGEPLAQAARAHFARGRNYANAGEYDAAIREFRSGFDAQPHPLFLFNIAQCARRGGRNELAVEYYGKYLAAEPNASDRAEVKRWISVLQKKPAGTAPGPAPAPAPATVEPPAAVAAAPSPALTLTVTPAAEPRRSRKPLWIALGVVGGVLVAGGLTLGLVLGLPSHAGPPSGYANLGSIDAASTAR